MFFAKLRVLCIALGMEVLSRRDAKISERKTYFTGKPCKNGHVASRYTGSGKCSVCNRLSYDPDYQRDYYQCNRQEKIAYAKQWAADNHMRVLKRVASWAAENPGRVAAAQRRWRSAHPELAKQRIREWEENNPGKRRGYSRTRRAREKNAVVEGDVTPDGLAALRARQNDTCPYCSKPLNARGHLDHIQPLSRGGKHAMSNLQWTCNRCNLRKGDKNDAEFRRYLLDADNAYKRPEHNARRKAA